MTHALDVLQSRLGHRFGQPALLATALTHRSFGADHNERLEFLGDAVLGLAISTLLYQRFLASDEGDLSRVRARLVRQDSLHAVALELDLPRCLRLGDGEARSGGALRASILADALEAVVGAVYLDAGFPAALQVVQRLFARALADSDLQAAAKDPKTQLQEWLQGRRMALPVYAIVETRGHAHQQLFVVSCTVAALGVCAHGQGSSRRAAEQEAARAVLATLKSGGS